MKKIVCLILLAVSLSACLKDNKLNTKIENEILNDKQEKVLVIAYEDKEYGVGEDLSIALSTELTTKIIAFDLIVDRDKINLKSIEKIGFTENENLVSTEEIEKGYRIIFSDLKNDLKKDGNFANIVLNVRWTGDTSIRIENTIEEN